jgi:hypothetical protein
MTWSTGSEPNHCVAFMPCQHLHIAGKRSHVKPKLTLYSLPLSPFHSLPVLLYRAKRQPEESQQPPPKNPPCLSTIARFLIAIAAPWAPLRPRPHHATLLTQVELIELAAPPRSPLLPPSRARTWPCSFGFYHLSSLVLCVRLELLMLMGRALVLSHC